MRQTGKSSTITYDPDDPIERAVRPTGTLEAERTDDHGCNLDARRPHRSEGPYFANSARKPIGPVSIAQPPNALCRTTPRNASCG